MDFKFELIHVEPVIEYVKTNLSAQSFWLKQGFQPTGAEFVRENYTVIEAEKIL